MRPGRVWVGKCQSGVCVFKSPLGYAKGIPDEIYLVLGSVDEVLCAQPGIPRKRRASRRSCARSMSSSRVTTHGCTTAPLMAAMSIAV
jgi:hypothetical protein